MREQRGLSTPELAAAGGMLPRRLQALEAGRLDPAYELVFALADALGVRPSVLITRAEGIRAKRGK
jgi:transcriptional regulator with XRE-family HTH domain